MPNVVIEALNLIKDPNVNLQKRGPKPTLTDPVEIFFRAQRGLAESVGEWAFYAAVVLIVIALTKRFPYRLFFKTHRLLAVAYLALVFHSVLLTPFAYWTQPMGIVLAVLMAGGSVAAVVSLAGRVGHRRKAVGEIEELVNFPDNRVLKVAIRFKDRWPGHEAGQFAFVTFSRDEGAHPFTISSGWKGDGRLFFLIKGIGDYTARLRELLRVGDLVTVEGPYGRFDFASGSVGGKRRQIWVGGGILLFILALNMFNAEPGRIRSTPEEQHEAAERSNVAVVPLTIPLLTGPGTVSTVIIHSEQVQHWWDMVALLMIGAVMGGVVNY